MGYRSEVAFEFQTPSYWAHTGDIHGPPPIEYTRTMREWIALYSLAEGDSWAIIRDEVYDTDDPVYEGMRLTDEYIRFHVTDRKWYGGYTDVDAYTKLVSWLGENTECPGTFVRIGEDDEDTEVTTFNEYDYDFGPNVTRSIEWY